MSFVCKFKSRLARQMERVRILGWPSYLRYKFARKDAVIPIRFLDGVLCIRKGSTDLKVVLDALKGEFEILRGLLPPDYAGYIVDAGGYIGTFTHVIKTFYPNARVLVIEASSENREMLPENVGGFLV